MRYVYNNVSYPRIFPAEDTSLDRDIYSVYYIVVYHDFQSDLFM